MKRVTRDEADCAELFLFVEKEFGKSWNTCCDIFHSSEFLTYKGYNDFELEDLEEEHMALLEELDEDDDFRDNYFLAHEYIIAFMKASNVEYCRIYS